MGNDIKKNTAQSEVNCTFKSVKSVYMGACISWWEKLWDLTYFHDRPAV